MLAISFAWTSAALVAGHKTVTRREWAERHAERFHAGDLVIALDRDRRVGGKPIALIRLVSINRLRMASMPLSDYQAEGMQWLYEHPAALPKSTPRDLASMPRFLVWKHAGGMLWVVRFRLVRVERDLPPHLLRWSIRQ